MLGRYTCVFDYMNLVPVVGSSRIPVRYHLWVSLAVAALASVGVDRLARPGRVRLGWAIGFVITIVVASVAILLHDYIPAWTDARRWSTPEHLEHFRWLGRELAIAFVRTVVLFGVAWALIARASKELRVDRRRRLTAVLPLLVIADLLGSHIADVPTIDPSYWTTPPESVARIKDDPGTIRVFGVAKKSAAEPGFASRDVDFFEVRDPLAWSLPPVWGLRTSQGHTPMYPRRVLTFQDRLSPGFVRFDVEGVTHILTGQPIVGFPGPIEKAGSAYLHRNTNAQPRARLMGRPAYVADEAAAGKALDDLGAAVHDRVIVEDPDRPLPVDAEAFGTATIEVDLPERVEVAVDAKSPAYLVLADTFDPGWSATLDGRSVPIRPAFSAFRAVYVATGTHRIVFTYEPAGFRAGLIVTSMGLVGVLICLAWPREFAPTDLSHVPLAWPRRWPILFGGLLLAIVLVSAFKVGPNGVGIHPRWEGSFHRFTWAAGIEAIKPMSKMLGR